jgi:NAD(P)H-dependent FMN reductase
MNQSRILVFAGSTRADSLNRKLAREAAAALRNAGAQVTHLELSDYPVPLYDGDREEAGGLPENVRRFKQLLREHHAVMIASPEYNGSFPALVKNLIDWATRPEPGENHSGAFKDKPVALLSASPGPGGGRRGLRHLRELLEMIGARVVPHQVSIAKAYQGFDENGALARPGDVEELKRLAAELARAA